MSDETWERLYASGRQLNRYPWDSVVSFLYGECARTGTSLRDCTILEIGCGSASNLWFAAREGAAVHGTDCSPSALAAARERFANDGLEGTFHLATLPDLPAFEAGTFDFIIDRSCLTHCSHSAIAATLSALAPLAKAGGRLFSTMHADDHSSYRPPGEDGLTRGITEGTLTGVGPVTFLSEEKVREFYTKSWQITSLAHRCLENRDTTPPTRHSEWHLSASPLHSSRHG